MSVHVSTPKEDILAFNVPHEYTNNEVYYVYLLKCVNNKAKR